MRRRTFLELAACLAVSCGRQTDPPRQVTCWQLDPNSGQSQEFAQFSLPNLKLNPATANRYGFVLDAANWSAFVPRKKSPITLLKGFGVGHWVNEGRLVAWRHQSADADELGLFEASSGEPIWKVKLPSLIYLCHNNDLIYFAHSGGVEAISFSSGKRAWINSKVNELYAWSLSPQALVVSAHNNGKLEWLDLKSGRSLHVASLNDKGMRITVVHSGTQTTLALVKRTSLVGVRPQAEKPDWSIPISSEEDAGELLGGTGEIALVQLATDGLLAIRLADGKKLWEEKPFVRADTCAGVVILQRPELHQGSSKTLLVARELGQDKVLWRKLAPPGWVSVTNDGERFFVLAEGPLEAV
jgi:hypothetical protein